MSGLWQNIFWYLVCKYDVLIIFGTIKLLVSIWIFWLQLRCFWINITKLHIVIFLISDYQQRMVHGGSYRTSLNPRFVDITTCNLVVYVCFQLICFFTYKVDFCCKRRNLKWSSQANRHRFHWKTLTGS